MPTATVKLKDGRTLKFQVKEGTTQAEIEAAVEEFLSQNTAEQPKVEQPAAEQPAPVEPTPTEPKKEEGSIGGIVTGLGAEVAIGTAGKYGGMAVGTAILPGIGTFIGYGIGALGSGIAGSITAQKAEGRDTISWGRALSAGLINLIPTPGAQSIKVLGKGAAKGFNKMAEQGIKYGALEGAATGVVEAQATKIIDEGRLATPTETLLYGATGATFGAGLGAAGKAISKKIKNKSPEEIDDIIYSDKQGRQGTEELTLSGYKGDKEAVKPEIDYQFERSKNAAITKEVVQEFKTNYDPNNISITTKIFQKLPEGVRRKIVHFTPSIVNRQIADVGLDYKNYINAGEDLADRVNRAMSRTIELNPETKPSFDKFLATGEIDDILIKQKVAPTLEKYRTFMQSQQKALINLIDSDAIKGLDEESKMLLVGKINQSLRDGDYTAQEYQIYTNKNFDFTSDAFKRKYEKAIDEITNQLNKGNDVSIGVESFDIDTGVFTYGKLRGPTESVEGQVLNNRDKAKDMVDRIIQNAASIRQYARQGAIKQATDSPVRARNLNEESNAALMDMMGVIKEPGEVARGTVTRLTKLVARASADKRMAEMLEGVGLATKKADFQKGTAIELDLRGGKSGLFVSSDTALAVQKLYAGDWFNNALDGWDNVERFLDDGLGLSKAVKVLGNIPSYPVQFYGKIATMTQLGELPVNPMIYNSGVRVALSDIDFMANSQKVSKEVLDDIIDAKKYGIVGGNIAASDIRANLEGSSTLVRKGLEPFANVYQSPDSLYRYYAWKITQKQLKEIYPDLAKPERAEDLKNAAAKLTNDIYEQYDKVNPILRKSTKVGFMPQFATFTMEVCRNQYNQARQLKDIATGNFGKNLGIDTGPVNKAASAKIFGQRAVGSAAVLGFMPAAFKAYEATHNAGEENKKRLNESYMPEYDVASPTIAQISDDNTKFGYMNSSYFVPQAIISKSFEAGFGGQSETDLIKLLKQEFVGEGAFFYRGILKGAINRKELGGEKLITTYTEENALKAAQDIFDYTITDMFRPGTAREVDKLIESTKPNARYTMNEVFKRQAGWRINNFNMEDAGITKARRDFVRPQQDKANWSTKLKYEIEQIQATPGLFETEYENANTRYQNGMQTQLTHYKNFSHFHGEEQAVDMLKRAGVSTKEILYLRSGVLPSLSRTGKQTTEDKLNAILPEGFNVLENTEANNKIIYNAIKKIDNPGEQKRMSDYVKRARSKKDSKLTSIESDLKNQSAETQIEYLKATNKTSTAYLKELAQKGVIKQETYYILLK